MPAANQAAKATQGATVQNTLVYPDIIVPLPASHRFSVQIFIILKQYITYQIHKLIGFQVFEWLSFGLICVFDS